VVRDLASRRSRIAHERRPASTSANDHSAARCVGGALRLAVTGGALALASGVEMPVDGSSGHAEQVSDLLDGVLASVVELLREGNLLGWSGFCSTVETRAYPKSTVSKIPDRQGYSSYILDASSRRFSGSDVSSLAERRQTTVSRQPAHGLPPRAPGRDPAWGPFAVATLQRTVLL
jgi:hypothetical protein